MSIQGNERDTALELVARLRGDGSSTAQDVLGAAADAIERLIDAPDGEAEMRQVVGSLLSADSSIFSDPSQILALAGSLIAIDVAKEASR